MLTNQLVSVSFDAKQVVCKQTLPYFENLATYLIDVINEYLAVSDAINLSLASKVSRKNFNRYKSEYFDEANKKFLENIIESDRKFLRFIKLTEQYNHQIQSAAQIKFANQKIKYTLDRSNHQIPCVAQVFSVFWILFGASLVAWSGYMLKQDNNAGYGALICGVILLSSLLIPAAVGLIRSIHKTTLADFYYLKLKDFKELNHFIPKLAEYKISADLRLIVIKDLLKNSSANVRWNHWLSSTENQLAKVNNAHRPIHGPALELTEIVIDSMENEKFYREQKHKWSLLMFKGVNDNMKISDVVHMGFFGRVKRTAICVAEKSIVGDLNSKSDSSLRPE